MYLKLSHRQDLLKFIRSIMYFAYMNSFHLERHLPTSLRSVAISLELFIELFLYFVVIHIFLLYICTIYINFDKIDLDFFVNCLIQTIIYWWVITVKLYFRRWQHKRLENLIEFLNLKYKMQSEIGFSYVTMDNCLAMSNKWVKLYVNCCFLGTLFWLLLPLAYGDRSLPLNCWYPFNYKQPIVYEAMYFLQFVGQVQVAAAFSASSGFHMVLCILISGQYDILYCSLKNILATVFLNSNTTRHDLRKLYIQQKLAAPEINEYYCSKEISHKIDTLLYRRRNPKCRNFRLQFRKAIKKCVNHHRYILRCLNKMEEFYSPIWFFKTAEIISLMCLVAFVAVKSTSANSSIIEILSLAQYMFLIVWELLVICYFGEIIYINSQRCGEAILRSPWYLNMREMKYDFLLFLLNSLRPFKLTAGKIFPLNNEFFKNMLSTGFSFLTLLQTMDQRFSYVTMDNCLAMSNKWVKLYVNCCFLGTLFWLLLPLAYGDRSLPLNCWYPFNYKQPIVYEAMYFLQFVGQVQVAAAFSASSGFHMVLCILISGQYDILYCSLKNILATVFLNSNTTRHDLRKLYIQQKLAAPEINEYYCSKEISHKIDTLLYRRRNPKCRNFRLQFRKAIKKCVNHHRYILRCLNKMEEFYSPIWFFKTAEIISLMCLVAFVAVKSTSANSSIIEILSLAQYMFLIVWELLVICYFGEIIYINSQRCGEAILRSPWYLNMREMKYDFLLFLLNSLRPFKLTAGKIFPLNNEFFKNMLSTGFSFLTLLQTMDQRNK